MRKLRSELVSFALVGTIAFAVDVSILYLVKTTVGIYWGRIISFICAVIVTWFFNRKFTFKDRFSRLSLCSEFLQYFILMLGGGSINYLVYSFLVSIFQSFAEQPIWGVVAGSAVGLLVNFLLARSVIFKVNK